uniref:Uncharacterized protein n=1 Tax=viral metagenome TaxID=1070528 RepID=A0A6C0BLQ4_9ZZZZ
MANHTILSLSTDTSDFRRLDIQIHAHQDSPASLHDHVKKHLLHEHNQTDPVVYADESAFEWEKLPNGFYGVAESDRDAVTIWERYVKPGRLYGETPRRRSHRVFMAIVEDVSSQPSAPATTVVKPAASAGSGTSYDQVVQELKETLARRRAEKADKMVSIHPTWNIHVNPLWVESGAVASPPSYEQVMEDSDAYPVLYDDVDDESSSDEEYYQKVKTDVIHYLKPSHPYVDTSEDSSASVESSGDENSEEVADKYFTWPSLECPAEARHFSEFWTEPIFQVATDFAFGEETTPLLSSNERLIRDFDQVEEEPTLEWLESYQKIINDWRVARGLMPYYECDESIEYASDDWTSSE